MATNPSERLASLDQFRGYTVAGMFLVNFLGGFEACPKVLKHSHDYLSYADTIMPQFLFAVGFAMRLTIGKKRVADEMGQSMTWRMVKRLLGLVLVSLIVYSVGSRAESWEQLKELGFWGAIADPLKRSWFQTLMHIAVASLWIVPVIGASQRVRWLWLIASAALHVWLSAWFNFEWVNTNPKGIDGGPLGFLTWAIPALVGSFACDLFVGKQVPRQYFSRGVAISCMLALVFMLVGYAISCGTRLYDVDAGPGTSQANDVLAANPVWPTDSQLERKRAVAEGRISSYLAEPPFVPPPGADERKWNYWMMSQRGGTLSYLVFSAGFSLAVFVLFFWVCDVLSLRLPLFRTLGTNALLGYVLHDLVGNAVKPFVPKDSPGWYLTASFLVFFFVTWLIVRHFEKQRIFLRV